MRARAAAEWLSRGVILRRRLPARFGGRVIYVSPGAGGLRYWFRSLERVDPMLFAAADLLPIGASVWDIGANVGLFTFAAAQRVGTGGVVVAVEPDVDNLRLILRSAATGGGGTAPVTALGIALAQAPCSFATLQVAKRCRASNALVGAGQTQMGGVRQLRTVPQYSLDALLRHFGPPDFVKIDVEGAESQVLAGAEELLESVRPALLLETEARQTLSLTRLLEARGYRFFEPVLTGGSVTWSCRDSLAENTLAVPEGSHILDPLHERQLTGTTR